MDDFEAAITAKLAASEAQAEETTEAEEVEPELEPGALAVGEKPEVVEEESEDKPRDEKGRFTAKDERPEWLPPQFKNVEDFARSYGELQSVLGRQGKELGELREIAQMIAQPEQPYSDLEESPEQVAYDAARRGDEVMLDRALHAWNQKALDEGDAVSLRNAQRFERDIEIAKLKYEFSQEVKPSIEQVQKEAGQRALAIARRELTAKYPDFDEVLESVTEDEVTGLDPNMIGQLQQQDPKAALEMVYRWVAIGRKSTAEASKEADRQEALERKRQAQVATSTSSPAAREKTNIEDFKKMLLEPEPHSVYHGLTRE